MSRNFQILTDTGCDLTQEYLEKNEIAYIRFGFTMDNESYQGEDGKEITTQDFYAKLRNGAMPTTYQINPETAKEHIVPYLEMGKDVLVIAFSSGLSGTADSFNIAAKELSEQYPERNIFVVDSLCASLGQGLLLHYVVEKANTGATIEETRQYAEDIKLKIAHEFTVNDLFHLKRGGRVSSTTAIIGTMLKIKPTLHVDNNGKLTTTGKSMGRNRSLRKLVENMLEKMDITSSDPIYIVHADCAEDAKFLKKLIKAHLPDNDIYTGYIGPVIGCHAGCGTIAVFFKAKKR